MKECSKSIARRMADSNFTRKYFVGEGVDIGGKPDPLMLYRELFCKMGPVKTWDWEDGDAQFMEGVADDTLDFVHSSHCLEHLHDPQEGLKNWLRVVKPGGHVIVMIPDEDLYEQGVFPSTFNRDHKWTFTMFKESSWSNRSINVLDLLRGLGQQADIQKIERLTASYRFDIPRYDQTLSPVGECGIEFVIRKRHANELSNGGQIARPTEQPERELRIHLNQHWHDLQTLKSNNTSAPPFSDDGPLR